MPPRTPSVAEDGPDVMLLETLRSRAPARDAQQVGVRQLGIVAGVFEIEVVFERQRDGVAQRQVDGAGAHQFLQARRIFEADAAGGDGPT